MNAVLRRMECQVSHVQSLAHLTDPPCTITTNRLYAGHGPCSGPPREHQQSYEPPSSTTTPTTDRQQNLARHPRLRAGSEFDDERSLEPRFEASGEARDAQGSSPSGEYVRPFETMSECGPAQGWPERAKRFAVGQRLRRTLIVVYGEPHSLLSDEELVAVGA